MCPLPISRRCSGFTKHVQFAETFLSEPYKDLSGLVPDVLLSGNFTALTVCELSSFLSGPVPHAVQAAYSELLSIILLPDFGQVFRDTRPRICESGSNVTLCLF